ncbi:DEAD/DEAH box helicase family protein [uncultured Thiodictyon sp.]|uniref:DEAD/DEAH box helicase family protein n=1 Tax=uncultured Thiodictyon sp. TaxID=1846217 RepID=UPI0025EEF515|nr:DEAD/DEAH box helicase family protein [uncultured Thiodictyon sp.]
MPKPTKTGIFDNEASAVDLRVYEALKALGWRLGDTLLYQPSYALTEDEQRDYPGSKSIRPDFVLQDIQGEALAVLEDKLDDPAKALPKLRLKYSRVLRPRFLYACAADGAGGLKLLFFDLAWRGVDAAEFRPVTDFMTLEAMKLKLEQDRQKRRQQEIRIDTAIAGGFDPAAGKERTYQLDCIRILLALYREGKMKMLVHMATGLGKTRTLVAFVKALLDYALARRILFVVDRRTLARQAINKGFSLLAPNYNSHWITSGSWRTHANKNIHVVVIDTLELLYDRIPSNFYDLIIVDECHRSITVNRNLVFDHFVCPRVGLTATPRIAVPPKGATIDDADLAVNDTYCLFGCASGEPDYCFDLAQGISEGFLAPYGKEEHITALTQEAMDAGVLYDHLLDPDTRARIEIGNPERIELERLNKRILSDEQAKRWAEILRQETDYGEKVLLFAASQAHSLMLVKAINAVFNSTDDSPRYAEAVISDNDDINESLKDWFERPYSNPRIVVSVDIMSTGVDVPCLRYVAFGALTKSIAKYLQMLGRGTRLDPKTGKFSFQILDFVGLCKRMDDNGKGTPKLNEKVVKNGANGGGNGGGGGARVDGILDNPDPASLIQRTLMTEEGLKIVDNIPVAQARELFENGVKLTMDPRIALLRRKAWEDKDYQPTEEELALVMAWAAAPDVILSEEQLQRIYDYPAGSVWDFFLAVLGVRKIPTTRERIESGFESYLTIYNFTDAQAKALHKIKDAFIANLSSQGRVDLDAIFANPIYARLIGSFEDINRQFDGRLREVVAEIQGNLKKVA